MPTTSDIDNVDHSVRYDGDDSLAPTSFLSTEAWQQVPRSLTKPSNLVDFAQCELDVLMVDPYLSELESVFSTETTEPQYIKPEEDQLLTQKSHKRRRSEAKVTPPSNCVTPTFGEETTTGHEKDGNDGVKGSNRPCAETSAKAKPKLERGRPWTEEEHKQFLIGLTLFGRGDWRSISRECIKTRTPTQIASHAQKYFMRQERKLSGDEVRRTSIHDICSVKDTLSKSKKRRAEKQDEFTALFMPPQPKYARLYPVSLPQTKFDKELQALTMPPNDASMPMTMPTLQAQTAMPHPAMLWPPSVQQHRSGMVGYLPPQPVWMFTTRPAS
jgi:SHAQKYF class myb-like DNA-binding protein